MCGERPLIPPTPPGGGLWLRLLGWPRSGCPGNRHQKRVLLLLTSCVRSRTSSLALRHAYVMRLT